MIRSEEEYQATQRRLTDGKKHLADEQAKLAAQGLDLTQQKRALDPMRSFLSQFEEELDTYERLKRRAV